MSKTWTTIGTIRNTIKRTEIDTQVKIKRKWRVKLENSQGAIIDNEAKKSNVFIFSSGDEAQIINPDVWGNQVNQFQR